jgi:hypothetical protein
MSKNDNATRRSEARERRRAAAREHDDNARSGDDSDERSGLETAARAAATAAALGAALGAVKALTSHDNDDDDEQPEPPTATEQDDEDDEPDEQEDDAEEQDAQADDEQQQEPTAAAREDEDDTSEPQQQERAPSRPREGASSGTVRSIAARAREQLRDLQGRDAESITALERTNEGWRVTCEIVEVERIPNSTDVLATYVIDLDGDGELIAFERVRRYYRAQADRGGEG